MTHHMVGLTSRHAILDARLREEQTRPHPDMAVMKRIKHQKLVLKDQIHGFR